ncbi:MAG: penicillin-binding protein 1B [Gammaproteobacteria bacterium]|nr:penicillin-binding protein 1B [Gammaproteobacteria bacterium]NNC98159.1 penicillin-binding protein 1B [Gammaproteobacteria bacterium]NNM13690.1 penicillin-binding protein 1B [Gammaproteobacteria bacterium]
MAKQKKPAKKRSKKKTGTTTADKVSLKSKFWKWFKRLFWTGLLLGILLAIILFLFAMHLNKTVVPQFEGRRWSVPARLYAQPKELYVGARSTSAELEQHLLDLGYKRAPSIKNPGDFSRQSNVIKVYVRPFQFWDGLQDAKQLQITSRAGRITAMKNNATGRDEAIFRLDPLILGNLFRGDGEDRIIVKLSDVPIELQQGVVAVEDRKYYQHFGIDLKGIMRALIADIKAGAMVQGASTLTQQMVRSYFLTNEKTFERKIKEILVTILLERKYNKEELLETYFNEIFMGQAGARAIHGMGMASRFYFNKPIQELKPHESAVLITLLRGPSYYNPRRNPDRVLSRRNLVLDIMHEQGVLDEQQHEFAKRQPLTITDKPPTGVSDYAAFLDLVKSQLARDYDSQDLNTVGLQIFTTLVPELQQHAENALAQGLSDVEKQRKLEHNSLQGAVIVTSVDGAEVQALVGGRESRYEGFNRAISAKRQIGSLMKPYVYLAALESGEFEINTILKDQPIEVKQYGMDEVWMPENYNKEFSGKMPLYKALALSKNVPTVHLGMQVGVDKVMQAATKTGLDEVPPSYPAMMLGSLSLAPVEVAQMYNTLANNGYRTPLRSVRAVLNENGEPLQRFSLEVNKVVDSDAMIQLNSILHLVTQKGTAQRLQRLIPDFSLAGKTGTSNDYRDAWFAGFSGDVSTVVWVGNDQNADTGLTGSSGALPIWATVMQKAARVPFATTPSENLVMTQFEFDSGYRMQGCSQTERDVILPARPSVLQQEVMIRCQVMNDESAAERERGGSERSRGVLDWLKDRL